MRSCRKKPVALELPAAGDAPKDVLYMAVGELPFDVLHDPENRIAETFGLVFELPESHRRLREMLNIDVTVLNDDRSYTFPDPATYVIAPSGHITWAFVPNNYR
jgi:peroxiredoxin